MAEEKDKKEEVKIINKNHYGGGGTGGAIYFFGLVGALVYYLQRAPTFMDGVIGVLKSIGWPGIIVFKVLELLKL